MKGILFKPDMIKAIVDHRKTVTRRIIKHPEKYDNIRQCDFCARYQVGEVVYIKEAWQIYGYKHKEWATIRYALDNAVSPEITWDNWLEANTKYGAGGDKSEEWRTPMFLREVFARYFIKITDVRAERLQEITEEDAVKEGTPINDFFPVNTARIAGLSTVDYYAELWNSINKDFQWESNPWVWRYEFEVISHE